MPPSLMEDVRGDTPLHLAAASGDRECVEAVLQLNNLALVRNRNGKTPVDVARGRTKAVLDEYVDLKKIAYTLSDLKSVSDDVSDITDKELADRFQAISIGEGDVSVETLMKACHAGEIEEVKALLAEVGDSAKWLSKSSDGNTPLHAAVAKGHLEVLQLIVDSTELSSAQVASATGFAGRTLLHQACEGGHSNLAQVLIDEFGSDLHTEDDDHHTPPHLAALNGRGDLTMLFVDKYGYPTKSSGTRATTLLHMASLGGHLELVETLISDYGSEVYALDSSNNSPLSLAESKGHDEVVALLQNNPYRRFGKQALQNQTESVTEESLYYEDLNLDLQDEHIQNVTVKYHHMRIIL